MLHQLFDIRNQLFGWSFISVAIKINYVATNSFVWVQKEYTASVESFVKNEIIFINFKSIKTF